MNDVNWFCNYMKLKLYPYQKLFLKIRCGKDISRMKKAIEKLNKSNFTIED